MTTLSDAIRALPVAKPLVWRDYSERCVSADIGGFASYAVFLRDDGQYSLRMSWSLLMTDGLFDTQGLAQAAAQADYETRIRAAQAHDLRRLLAEAVEGLVNIANPVRVPSHGDSEVLRDYARTILTRITALVGEKP